MIYWRAGREDIPAGLPKEKSIAPAGCAEANRMTARRIGIGRKRWRQANNYRMGNFADGLLSPTPYRGVYFYRL